MISEPVRYRDYISLAILSYQDLVFRKPKSYEKAIDNQQFVDWKAAMKDEMDSLIKK